MNYEILYWVGIFGALFGFIWGLFAEDPSTVGGKVVAAGAATWAVVSSAFAGIVFAAAEEGLCNSPLTWHRNCVDAKTLVLTAVFYAGLVFAVTAFGGFHGGVASRPHLRSKS